VAGGGNTWCEISAGSFHTAAVKTDGSAWTWGLNSVGQLGDNTTVSKSSPVAVTHASGNINWCQISAGSFHTVAVKSDGTAWTWGNNVCGRLGDGTVVSKSSPVALAGTNTCWCQIHAGNSHSAAIKTDSTAWTWGRNTTGQLGDNSAVARSSPGAVAGVNADWCNISAGYHTAAIKTDGTVWTWGLNNCGQLGNGVSGVGADRSSPVLTSGGGTTWCAIDASDSNHTAAVKTDGTAWTWGNNTGGRLGDGTVVSKSSPVQVTGGLTWCAVSAGCNFTMGIQAI
jgi:alpha-tubulin suppressor-like RCC1 family protein